MTVQEKFQEQYDKILKELDNLSRGHYDTDDAKHTSALCLLASSNLIKIQSNFDLEARSLKRDIDFAKANVYCREKGKAPSTGPGKITDTALNQMVTKDEEVVELYKKQLKAEKESKELANVLELLKDAHITFRLFSKKGD